MPPQPERDKAPWPFVELGAKPAFKQQQPRTSNKSQQKNRSKERLLYSDHRLGENALFLQRADSLSTKYHSYLLAIDFKSFLLKVRLEHAICATQREADVLAKLLSFTGEFTSCNHNYFPSSFNRTLATIVPFFTSDVKGL